MMMADERRGRRAPAGLAPERLASRDSLPHEGQVSQEQEALANWAFGRSVWVPAEALAVLVALPAKQARVCLLVLARSWAGNGPAPGDGRGSWTPPTTVAALARELGISREHLSRTLAGLASQGVLEVWRTPEGARYRLSTERLGVMLRSRSSVRPDPRDPAHGVGSSEDVEQPCVILRSRPPVRHVISRSRTDVRYSPQEPAPGSNHGAGSGGSAEQLCVISRSRTADGSTKVLQYPPPSEEEPQPVEAGRSHPPGRKILERNSRKNPAAQVARELAERWGIPVSTALQAVVAAAASGRGVALVREAVRRIPPGSPPEDPRSWLVAATRMLAAERERAAEEALVLQRLPEDLRGPVSEFAKRNDLPLRAVVDRIARALEDGVVAGALVRAMAEPVGCTGWDALRRVLAHAKRSPNAAGFRLRLG